MVVKNVAGLDMGKLMIGSFGTLAAIAVVNFKLIPQPPRERTFRFSFAGLDEALAARDAILKSPLDPAAIDLLNPSAAAIIAETETPAYVLAVRAGGNAAAIARYERDLAAMGAQPVPQERRRRLLARDPGVHAALSRYACRWRGGARLMYPERVEAGDALDIGTGDGARGFGRLLRLL